MPVRSSEILASEFWESLCLSSVSEDAAEMLPSLQPLEQREYDIEKYRACATGYDVTGILGYGAEAIVLKATNDAFPGRHFALKKFFSPTVSRQRVRAIDLHEGKLQNSSLKFLVPIVTVVQDQLSPGQKIIVMNEAMGSLETYLARSGGSIPACEAKCIFYQLLGAMQELEELRIVHRDIKPGNILFYKVRVPQPDGSYLKIVRAKVGDFGYAREVSEEHRADSQLGTREYMAPELFGPGKPQYTFEVDRWSTGAVLMHMKCGQVPFAPSLEDAAAGHKQPQRTQAAIDRQLSSLLSKDDVADRQCKQILQKCLFVNPSKRAQVRELLSHKWLESCHNMGSLVSAPSAAQLGMSQMPGLMSTFAQSAPEFHASASAAQSSSAAGREGSFSSNDTTMAEPCRDSPDLSSEDTPWTEEKYARLNKEHEDLGRLIEQQKQKRAAYGLQAHEHSG